jgi:hypothetical protein
MTRLFHFCFESFLLCFFFFTFITFGIIISLSYTSHHTNVSEEQSERSREERSLPSSSSSSTGARRPLRGTGVGALDDAFGAAAAAAVVVGGPPAVPNSADNDAKPPADAAVGEGDGAAVAVAAPELLLDANGFFGAVAMDKSGNSS